MRYVDDEGNINFRHPLVADGKYRKVVHKRVKKLPSREQAAIDDDLVWLHETKSSSRADALKARSLHPAAADMWFAPIEAAARQRELEERARKGGFPIRVKDQTEKEELQSRHESRLSDAERLRIEEWNREDAEKRAKKAEKAVAELQKTVTEMGQRLGAAELNKESVTLGECLRHFETNVSCASEDAKAELMRRVTKVVAALGVGTPHGTVTKRAIEEAVGATLPGSDAESRYRRRDISRFFKLLSAPFASDGLGLPNPAVMMKIGSGEKIQRERRQKGLIKDLDPKELLKNKNLSDYWKALVALCGYAGLRLKEAAAMEWGRMGDKGKMNWDDDGVIRVRATADYPKLKSVMSERDVKPFPNITAVLKKHRKTARHKRLLFDREGSAGPTWFREYRGKPTAADLSGALIDAIGAAIGMRYTLKDGRVLMVRVHREKAVNAEGKPASTFYLQLMDGERLAIPKSDVVSMERPQEPARRLRRFWETSMREAGLGDLIEPMGGHSKEVGMAHYARFEGIVKKAKIPKL